MKGIMPTLFARTVLPPCERDGAKCPDRCTGCHAQCEKYAAWAAEREETKRNHHTENAADYVRRSSYKQWKKFEEKPHGRKKRK